MEPSSTRSSSDALAAEKSALREASKGRDESGATDSVVVALESFPPMSGSVVGYGAMPTEIDVVPLSSFARVRFHGVRIDAEGALRAMRWSRAHLERHPYGFMQPTADAEPLHDDLIDVVLVPGRAFDRHGRRLGRGAGYYDRFLSRLPRGVITIGVTVEAAVVDAVPTGPLDRSVDWLVTERGVRRVGGELQEASLRFVRAAIERGIAAAPIRFPQGTKTSADAAAAIGCSLGAIAKSLVFRVDDEPVLVICSGDRQIDESRLASFLSASSASVVPLREVKEISGYAGGGTPAVGHTTPLRTVVDTSLGRYRWVWSAAGTPDTVYPVSLERLVAATDARIADIAKKG